MYTNGFTGQPMLSVVAFKDANGDTHCYMDQEFAAQSEHVVIETVTDSGIAIANDGRGSIGQVFTGL